MATLTGPLNKSANTSGTTLVAKATTDTTYSGAIGDMLVLAFVCNSSTATVTVADSAGNTWVQVDSASGGASNLLRVFVCRLTIALPTNGTVTVTCTSVSRRASQLYKISGAGGFLSRNKALHAVGATTALSIGSFGSTGEADEYAFKFDGMTPAGVASGRADATAGWTDKGTVDSGGATVSVSLGSSFIATVSRNSSQFANTATQSTAAARASISLSIRGISAPTDGLVQTFSDTGTAANTDTMTPLFTPTTGNTLIAVVATNENTGADDINTPTGWTLIGTVRNVAGTHVRMKVFGITVADWIALGSPALTFTTTAAQRLQVSMGEFSGVYNLTAEATNTNEGTSNTSGTTGSVTPLGTGRLVIMAFAEKNAQPVRDSAVPPVFPALTVWNEDPSTLSTQKLNVFVGYVTNRGASATSISTAWDTTLTAWAGISVSLAPAAAPDAFAPAATQDRDPVAYERPRYDPTRSQVASVFAPLAVAAQGWSPGVLDPQVPFYRGAPSAFMGAADEPIPSESGWFQPPGSRAQAPYNPLESLVVPVFAPAAVAAADAYTPGVISERPVVSYLAPRSTAMIVAAPSPYAPPAVRRERALLPVSPSLTIPVYAPAVVVADAWAQVLASRALPVIPRGRSLTVAAFTPAAAAGPDAWIQGLASRKVPPYVGSYSAFMGAADEEIVVAPDAYTPGVIQSRPVAAYAPSRGFFVLGLDDHACTTLLPDTILGPDTMLFPDLCPQTELGIVVVSRQLEAQVGRSFVVSVYDSPAAPAGVAYTPGVIRSWPLPLLERKLSVTRSPMGIAVVADTYASVTQSNLREVILPSGSTTILPRGVIPEAYVPLARSSGTLEQVARESLTIVPRGALVIIVQAHVAPAQSRAVANYEAPPSQAITGLNPSPVDEVVNYGGGGEWVIWGKPDFPGNRPGAWPRFPRPGFKRPSRYEKRGY